MEGYPYLRLTCVTNVGTEEEPVWDTAPFCVDFSCIQPIYWFRHKLPNKISGALETVTCFCFVDAVFGNLTTVYVAETFPKFDALIRQWIEHSNKESPKE